MIYHLSYFEPWGGGVQYRESLKEFDAEDWVSPSGALAILQSARAGTPMRYEEFLAWRAALGLLPSIALQIVDTSSGSSDRGVYERVPLSDEWSRDEWKSASAELWTNGNMRMTRPYAGQIETRDFLSIAFRRLEVEAVAQGWPSAPHATQESGTAIAAKRVMWTSDKMTAEIRACPIGNRDRAWSQHFKARFEEHGWKNAAFRDHWPMARGTRGLRGRPAALP
jgi:hypothetical protein